VGNRLTEVEEFGTVVTNAYAYPPTSNRIADIRQGTTTVRSFSYDASGNMTRDTRGAVQYNYAYNNRGRLSQSLVGASVRGNYRYDGFERLAMREVLNTAPSGKTHYLYDEDDDIIAEAEATTGAILREYIYLPGEGVGGGGRPIAVIDQANTATPKTYWIAADHLDRPVLLTDAARAIQWRAEYRPFGEVASITGPLATDTNVQTRRFPGQFFQLETGLAYNWHRHYEASLGRYTQADSIGLAGGVSVYGYGEQTPIAATDRAGMFSTAPWPGTIVPTIRPLPPSLPLPVPPTLGPPGPGGKDCNCPVPAPRDNCEGLRKQIAAHEKKFRDFAHNPRKYDNKGLLGKGDDPTIIYNRLMSLSTQIEMLKRELKKCEERNSGPLACL
jgi:RHS repeat-associated protein